MIQIEIRKRNKLVRIMGACYYATNDDLYEEIQNEDIQYICAKTKIDITHIEILKLLFHREKKEDSKIDLNKIIRNGGFLKYIRELEDR